MKIKSVLLLCLFYIATAGVVRAAEFKHPGGWFLQSDLNRIRNNVAAGREPFKSAWAEYKNRDADVKSGPSVKPDMDNAYGLQNQGHAAYVLAIKWVASGDLAYAKASIRIIDAWSSTVTSIPKEPMRSGLGSSQMAQAAEILAWGFNGAAGWPKADADRARKFFKEVVYPRNGIGAAANWGTSAMTGIVSMAVFCDDHAMFDRGINAYKHGFLINGSTKGGCCGVTQYVDATGEDAETGRDQGHSQGGIAHLVEVALVAWNQGIDLVRYNDNVGVRDYGMKGDNRLLLGLEYTAKYNLGNDVPYHPFFEYCNNVFIYKTGPSDKGRGNFSPVWEMAAALFHQAKLGAPFCDQVIEKPGYAPEGTNSDHPGMGTLVFRQ